METWSNFASRQVRGGKVSPGEQCQNICGQFPYQNKGMDFSGCLAYKTVTCRTNTS